MAQNDIKGLPLPSNLLRLLYFNGRFMTAADMTSEQNGMLTRHRLAEKAQGPGISYGLFVSIDVKTKNMTITAGHAADGDGQDLYLASDFVDTSGSDTMLFKLAAKYRTRSLTLEASGNIGPVITPLPGADSLAALSGMYLLAAARYENAAKFVPDLGTQCTDGTANCQAGAIEEGISLDLVQVTTLPTGGVTGWSELDFVGWGARTYFGREQNQSHTALNEMLRKEPQELPRFSRANGDARGTHVPLAALYFENGTLRAYDVWTARRLRAPSETARWLGSLLEPAETAQLSRILQFQTQLLHGLPEQAAFKAPMSLWDPKLALADAKVANASLVLPGCGFLPIVMPTKDLTLEQQIKSYFTDGAGKVVPFRLRAASQGEMNALFNSHLAAGDLWLNAVTKADLPGRLEDIQIWYPSPSGPAHPAGSYDNYVMFTWPVQKEVLANVPSEPIQQDLHACVAAVGTDPGFDDKSQPIFSQTPIVTGRDDEWVGLSDADKPLPLSMQGIFWTSQTTVPVEITLKKDTKLLVLDPTEKKDPMTGAVLSWDLVIQLEYDMSGPKSTVSQVVEKVTLNTKAMTVVAAQAISGSHENDLVKTGSAMATGRQNPLLSQINCRLTPALANVQLQYRVAMLDGTGPVKLGSGTGPAVGDFKPGRWTPDSAATPPDEWCQGALQADPDGQPPSRCVIYGVQFRLVGPDAHKYVVRYKVAGKIIPLKGVLSMSTPTRWLEGEFFDSNVAVEGAEDTTYARVYAPPKEGEKPRLLPIHRIFMKVLPRCMSTWPSTKVHPES